MLSASSSASDAGISVKASALSVERWSAGSKRRIAVDLVAEEIEAKRQLLAGREQVDQRAAHGIFAMFGDGIGALVAKRVQLLDESLALDPLALGDSARELPDAKRRQHSLRRRARRRNEQLRLFALRLERAQRCQPLRHDAKRGGGAVVGQAVPAGKGQHLDFGREQRHRFGKRAHRRFVGDDRDRAPAFACPMSGTGEDRRRATAGSPSERPQESAARRREGRAAAARSSRDPDVIELLQRFDHWTGEARWRLGSSMRPGHDVDVLFLEHRLEARALASAPQLS